MTALLPDPNLQPAELETQAHASMQLYKLTDASFLQFPAWWTMTGRCVLPHSHFRFCDRSPYSHVVVQWKPPPLPVLPLDLEKHLIKAEPGMGGSHLAIDEVGLQMERNPRWANQHQLVSILGPASWLGVQGAHCHA